MNITQSLYIFTQFLRRDIIVFFQEVSDFFINNVLFFPLVFAFSFAYLQTNIFFGPGQEKLGTMIFVGNILVIIMVMTYKQTIELLFDLVGNRFIDYQISILQPRLVILERIIFTTLFTFLMALPFYPVAKLALWHYIDTSHMQWGAFIIILFLGSLCCSAYHMLAACYMSSPSQITTLWARVNIVLITLGGFWIPLFVIKKFSTTLTYLVYLNPLIYISEGLRQAIIGGEQFLSINTCIGALCMYSVIFTLLALYYFKQRTDHI